MVGERHLSAPLTADWRAALLRGSLLAAVALATIAFPVIMLQAITAGRPFWLGMMACFYVVLVLTTFSRSLTYRTRTLGLLGVLGLVGVLGFVRVGFQVGPSLACTLVVVLAGLLLGSRASALAFVVMLASILGVGAYQATTDATALAPHVGDASLFTNWLRTGAAFALFTGILAAAVTFVVSHVEHALRDRTEALERLRAAVESAREAQEALGQAQRTILQMQKLEAIGRLAGGVAHDFNNALVVILGWADLLRAKPADTAYLQSGLNEITAAGNRAASLTQQLLAFGRQGRLVPRPLSPLPLLADLSRMLQRLLPADIVLETRVLGDVRPIHADPGQMHQVLLNLCLNARDAMPHGGTLEICAFDFESTARSGASEGSWVALRVRDTGIGMDAETQARVFEPFFTTKGELGTGLGLASVYGIVQQSGGHVMLDSAPGRGSTFTVLLPPTDAANAAVERCAPANLQLGCARATILVAEDELAVRTLMVRALEAAGHRVLAAANGGEALQLARRYRGTIDLLCTDGVLPGISSASLIADFRILFPNAKVLLCSGHVDRRLQGELAAEPPHYLDKPFTGDDLARTVRDVLDDARAARRLRASTAPSPSRSPGAPGSAS